MDKRAEREISSQYRELRQDCHKLGKRRGVSGSGSQGLCGDARPHEIQSRHAESGELYRTGDGAGCPGRNLRADCSGQKGL